MGWTLERERWVLVIAGDPGLSDFSTAADALGLGTRRVDCAGSGDLAAIGADDRVIALDVRGLDEGGVADLASRVDHAASARGVPVVAALGNDQIDVMAASFATAQATLLCDPAASEIAAALVVAGQGGARPVGAMREGEDARLHRLNSEVARIAEVLARLTAQEPAAGQSPSVADRRQAFDPGTSSETIDPSDIRRAIRARRIREQFFDRQLMEDPGWDMLLDLFAAELENVSVSVSSLCIASAVASTTALRWIAKMTQAGLMARRADPFDRRRAYMVLTPAASAGMYGYLAAVRRAGLGIA